MHNVFIILLHWGVLRISLSNGPNCLQEKRKRKCVCIEFWFGSRCTICWSNKVQDSGLEYIYIYILRLQNKKFEYQIINLSRKDDDKEWEKSVMQLWYLDIVVSSRWMLADSINLSTSNDWIQLWHSFIIVP